MNSLPNLFKLFPIHKHKYAQWFQNMHFNGKVLSDSERKDVIDVMDYYIKHYIHGLSLLQKAKASVKVSPREDIKAYHQLSSSLLFVTMTIIDSMVISKYFLLAKVDYEQRLMRGKLFVIMNEGFKRLFGFDEKTQKKSEWKKLSSILDCFPNEIKEQYNELTPLLERHANNSTWWKDERNCETHLDAEQLFESRQKQIIESKVMMDSLKLYETLFAVDVFISNMHACMVNHFTLELFHREDLDIYYIPQITEIHHNFKTIIH